MNLLLKFQIGNFFIVKKFVMLKNLLYIIVGKNIPCKKYLIFVVKKLYTNFLTQKNFPTKKSNFKKKFVLKKFRVKKNTNIFC